jgi:DtxR family Mn-dependent transcriptional regulator
LEDYLETLFELCQNQEYARVRDIAKARGVKAASVSPAMRRLADMGFIKYVRREYISLTPAGQKEARRIYAKHKLLVRFLKDVLNCSNTVAQEDACAIEHSLSANTMERMVAFFEYIGICPEGQKMLDRFHHCARLNPETSQCDQQCLPQENKMSLADIKPGNKATVTQVEIQGAIRQRLLDMGIIPKAQVEVERVAPAGDPIWIKLQGYHLSLRKNEAQAVKVIKN